jgi:benzodiazapine receptor
MTPRRYTNWRNSAWLSLVAFLAVCLFVQLAGGILTSMSVDSWYPTLEKPKWNPPGWVFGPVWTVLYLSIAFAGWLIWQQRSLRSVRPALVLFGIQLSLNLLWSGLFFGMRNPMLAFFEIILLWVAILLTTIAFWRLRPKAGMLLLPYLAWVGFAALLNFSIWRMNA